MEKIISNKDTIVAQATPPGRGGVGVIRISGLKAKNVAEKILGKIPKPRYANYLSFKDTENSNIILDRGIALWFPGPNSFTGEDTLELQCHGGPVIIDLILKNVLKLNYVRIANPGEFSERAFLNNKIDLIQAEAIIDLINANSEHAVHSALNSLQGLFSVHINNLLSKLIYLRTYVESSIDFSDEEIDQISIHKIESNLNTIITNLHTLNTEAYQGCLINDGLKITIVGPPNSGKSSLFNALSKKDAAIVTDIAGTTRDILREYIYIDGISLNIIDTAGLQNTNDKIEIIGIERTWQEIKKSDRIIFVIDSSKISIIEQTKMYFNFIKKISTNIPITVVRNKIDITGEPKGISTVNNYTMICLSVINNEGIDILLNHLRENIKLDTKIEGCFLARRRHLQALLEASRYLEHSKSQLKKENYSYELLAEDLRMAQQKLNLITGEFTSDDLLKEIFSKFCIGK